MARLVKVKICGITNEEDARWAANLGADYLGLNFCAESPRKVSVDKARQIALELPPFVQAVGVFVDAETAAIEKTISKVPLKVVQLHGNEGPERVRELKGALAVQVWKAFRIESEESLAALSSFSGLVDAALLDGFQAGVLGGTGEAFDWTLAHKAKSAGIPIVLAGGLKPENVAQAVEEAQPMAVDVASGVEKEGHPRRKDLDRMKAFIQIAKRG